MLVLKDMIRNKSIEAFWKICSKIVVDFRRYLPKSRNILKGTFVSLGVWEQLKWHKE
jgi:hypothetical protein